VHFTVDFLKVFFNTMKDKSLANCLSKQVVGRKFGEFIGQPKIDNTN